TVDLIAADLGETKVRPGETLPLALYWRAIAPMDRSYTVFVQAVDDEGTKVGQVDRLPCNGDCPTATWRPGDLVGERYDLAVRGDALPGQYRLIVGMYDLETGENLTAYDSQGNAAGTYLELGAIQVSP
ncbi:MAG TPA: hypothetical protein VLY63_02505, partial [Anaerolineae bacterium]|nr:hypothetical protein [Anaerolineae bacterium]